MGVSMSTFRSSAKSNDKHNESSINMSSLYEKSKVPVVLNGFAKQTHASGNIYIGEFKDGARHGFGKLIYADGRIEVGLFQNGTFKGSSSSTRRSSCRMPSESSLKNSFETSNLRRASLRTTKITNNNLLQV